MFRKSSERIVVQVRTYSGFRADERPVSFTIGSVIHSISGIIGRHREHDEEGERVEVFIVTTLQEREFILEHVLGSDQWFAGELESDSG